MIGARLLAAWILALLLAACSATGLTADRDRHDGFYGGVSGGLSRP